MIQGHNKTRYSKQNNKNNRTIGIRKYLRRDLTKLGNRVGSGHPCAWLGSSHFWFSGFRVFRELQGRVRVCLGNCRDAAASLGKMQENLRNCREASGRVWNIPKISQHYFESVTGCNSISPSRTSPRGPRLCEDPIGSKEITGCLGNCSSREVWGHLGKCGNISESARNFFPRLEAWKRAAMMQGMTGWMSMARHGCEFPKICAEIRNGPGLRSGREWHGNASGRKGMTGSGLAGCTVLPGTVRKS